jgi:hypothetical protein
LCQLWLDHCPAGSDGLLRPHHFANRSALTFRIFGDLEPARQ